MDRLPAHYRTLALALALGAVLLVGALPAAADDKGTPAAFMEVFEQSMKEKKGVTVYLRGQGIPMIVTKINNDTVEGRNQTSDRIVIRLSKIDGVSLN